MAYGLPIVDWVLRRRLPAPSAAQPSGDGAGDGAAAAAPAPSSSRALVALVLCPTRELALQVWPLLLWLLRGPRWSRDAIPHGPRPFPKINPQWFPLH